MMSIKQFCIVGVVMMFAGWMGASALHAAAYPEPRIVTDSWELEFEFDEPRTIAVERGGETRLYWYMTYTVRNESGEDQLFVPEAWAATDAGDLLAANRDVPPAVFRAIEEQEDNPLLENPVQVVGRLLQGEDNARDSVFIWPVPEHDVDYIRMFIGGLSGETHDVEDPETGETYVLRKTLMLEYATPGDVSHTAQKPFIFEGREWVVR